MFEFYKKTSAYFKEKKELFFKKAFNSMLKNISNQKQTNEIIGSVPKNFNCFNWHQEATIF